MKISILLLSTLFFVSVSNAQKKPFEDQKSHRIEKIINSQWTFNYFTNEAAVKSYESPGFDDSKWPAISLPHTWSTYETTGEFNPFNRNAAESANPYWWTGWGWYRKHFSINRDYSGRKVFIEFEGVQKYCKVWLNGKYLGDHKGGYGSFDFDITQFLKPGEDNVLAVAVNNFQKDKFEISPMAAGNFNVYGGIYRDVTLVLKDKLYIPMQGSAAHEGGTFVTTPQVSEKEAVVRVQTWVKNDNPEKRNCTLQTSIADATNKIVQVIKSEAVINPGQLYKFDQTGKSIKNPHLWSNEDPYLYKVYSEVIDGKTVVDTYTSPLGFRWFRWDYKDDFLYVNGKKMVIHGGNRHQEYTWLGDAIPKWITVMDYTDIAENLNYNFMRTAHYSNDKLVYELADKFGIAIDEESPSIENQVFSVEEQEQQIKEMIRRDRNHPSIMFWSMSNKTNHAVDSKFAMTEDTTRILTVPMALDSPEGAYVKPADENLPITAQAVIAGEPAKIVLTGSNQKMMADRGSVSIITADIVDSKGNHVYGATNTIKWNVSGPATLVGPPVFESDISKHDQMDGVWYMDMPVSNVIRSTGKPGKIHISVLASGLASGSFDIEAEEIKPDNSVIGEPVLENEGRKQVTRITLNVNRLEEVPREIKMTYDEFNLSPSDKPGFARVVKDYILKNNPSLDSASIEFYVLIDLFASHLLNNNGRLVADDYNFSVDYYNNCRLISGYITSTKLPPLFKEGLRKYYANAIIRQGSEKNAGDEMNWLNWIPSGGTVVIVQNENTKTNLKGAIFTKQTGLAEIINVVYPQFINFTEEAKERALIFISKMNPYIHVTSISEQSMEGAKEKITNVSYTAEKGQPILIPLLKFISE
jgi:Glycosyl hydrolases family 2, sugar binding domain/Glycosyl hydrolases family 2, TIM barrel domain/Glycosyl hydrolases family 2/Glycoside hydrolase family 2 C-terminal domain 5